MRRTIFLSLIAIFIGLSTTPAIAQTKGSSLPLPRFVSLHATIVNMRTGPGLKYPVKWVYRRKFLPIEIIAEYGTWRKVRDWQNTQGWVHVNMLSGQRTFIVTHKVRTVRRGPDTKSPGVAGLEPGVIGRVQFCPANSTWCRVEVDGRDGWLRRAEFWGVYRHESLE